MSTYTDASLIMFPSGYKEDKIYSLKPTDGSGDLTFTRASTATRVNSDGLIETSPVNLLQNSENFDSVWTKYNGATVTVNAISAPNGTTAADLLIAGANQEVYSANMPKVAEELYYTFSCYAKLYNTNVFKMTASDFSTSGVDVNFNLSTITATYVTGATWSNSSASIESVGNGWYRCILTSKSPATTGLYLSLYTSGTNSVSGVYIWGAQVNIGATAKPYFPTTDRLNVPRIDYTGGGCGSLLLEPQRTNLLTYSEQFDNAAYTKNNATITTNVTYAPDGVLSADKLAENTNNTTHEFFRSITQSTGGIYTISYFVKANGRTKFKIAEGFSIGGFVSYDLVAKTATTTAPAVSGFIEEYNDGWFRVGASWNLTGGANTIVYFVLEDNAGNSMYTGDGTSGVFVWGAQLEQGSYPTSYIPTLASSVTRLADAASKTGISSLINSTEGVLYVELSAFNDQTLNNWISISQDANINANQFNLRYVASSNLIQVVSRAGGLGQNVVLAYTLTDKTALNKIAIKYKVNDWALWVNGVEVDTETSSTAFTANSLDVLDFNRGNDSNFFYGNVQNLMIFPSALSDTDLATLTTL